MAEKSPRQVANINARAAIGNIRTMKGLKAVLGRELGENAIEPGTVASALSIAYRIGHREGVKEATE